MNKKVSNSRERIIELMQHYGLNQTELCNRTGLQKSALSNYLNGDREPRQTQISLIADPFNVNPAWLMGYDVPMELPLSDVEKEKLNANADRIREAMLMYNAYANATPDVRQAVEILLKATKPISDAAAHIEIPHLKAPQSSAELPHLKKDNKK